MGSIGEIKMEGDNPVGRPAEGVLVVDSSKRIVFVDRTTSEILGTEVELLLGRHCSDLREILPCAEESCDFSGACRLYMLPGNSSDVNPQPIVSERSNEKANFRSHPIRSDDGIPLGIVHVVTLSEPLSELRPSQVTECGGLIGNSAAMRKVYEMVSLVAKTNVTVSIVGESGTGKELIAEAVHKLSDRSAKRLVTVNCSTIPHTLLESALFGHVKGAFTGAHKEAKGFVEYANGGTLFLDEIGDVSLEVQVKLLRLLQSREYQRVGDTQTLHADLRIITATNQDLRSLINAGKVREDFYYRINVFPISMPPLREREGDIELLASHFVTQFNSRFIKNIQGVADSTLAILKKYQWPGNVRELEHAIEHAFVKAANGYLQPEHLPDLFPTMEKGEAVWVEHPALTAEEAKIVEALESSAGNVTKAARSLGYSRVTLWKKMKQWNISRSKF